jgi:hypothetical protein
VLNALGLSLLDEASWVSGPWDESNPIDDEVQGFMIRNLLRGGTIRHDRLGQPHGVATLSSYFSAPIWEVARRMPRELRFREVSKPILRILLDRYLPPEVGRWSKMGFEVPWEDWLQGELAPLCAEADGFLRSTSYLPPGFWNVSNQSRDREGIWTGLSLYLLLREFDLPLE